MPLHEALLPCLSALLKVHILKLPQLHRFCIMRPSCKLEGDQSSDSQRQGHHEEHRKSVRLSAQPGPSCCCCHQVWRPLKQEVEESPLGFIDAATVDDKDLNVHRIEFPGRTGYNYALSANPEHRSSPYPTLSCKPPVKRLAKPISLNMI